MKIAISFDVGDFVVIRDMAHKEGVAFQEQVRRLCKAGLAKGKK